MTTGCKAASLHRTEKTLTLSGSLGMALWLCGLAVLSLGTALPARAGSQDQSAPASGRFVLVLGGEAVRDQKTGLIWEASARFIPRRLE
jgi:hypothetical protein